MDVVAANAGGGRSGLTPSPFQFDLDLLGSPLEDESKGERFGDSGLLASDLPDAIAVARKRLAGVAARRYGRGRIGFALARERG